MDRGRLLRPSARLVALLIVAASLAVAGSLHGLGSLWLGGVGHVRGAPAMAGSSRSGVAP